MKSRACGACAAAGAVPFDNETFNVVHADLNTEVKGLAGWRCGACGEVEFDRESARRYAAAGDELVLRARDRAHRNSAHSPKVGYESSHGGPIDWWWAQCLLPLPARPDRAAAGRCESLQTAGQASRVAQGAGLRDRKLGNVGHTAYAGLASAGLGVG